MSTLPQHANADDILLRDDRAGVCTLTLNRPTQYNALSEEMLSAVQRALDDLAADASVRAVVLAASGKAFCAGHDLKQMRARPDEAYYQRLFRQCAEVMKSIVRLPQPVIARVQGVATAAGCQLVATCDLAVASTDARFAVSGVNLGLFCATPSVALSRNVLRKPAFEMLITGELIDAARAQAYGLVNRVVAPDALDAALAHYTESILDKPAVAVATGKRMFQAQLEKNLDEAYDYAAEVMACNMLAEDTTEGIDAFIEKREPRWRRG